MKGITLLLIASFVSSFAADEQGKRMRTNGSPASTLSNVNHISTWLRDNGWSARDPVTGNSGFTFPRQTAQAIFQDGILWGGAVSDGTIPALRVGGQTYNVGTAAGRIITQGVAEDPAAADVRIFRVRRDFQTADLLLDAAEINHVSPAAVTLEMIDSVRAQYQRDWTGWPTQKGAPFYDNDSNGVYNPPVDEPGLANADQVIWFVANDLNPALTDGLYGSPPIGLEMQGTLWAYNTPDVRSNVVFKRIRLIYKGTATTAPSSVITDMYITQWSDPDLGTSGDDFVGYDTTNGLGYVYNAGPVDNQYASFGLVPPSAGYVVLQGPLIPGTPADTGIFNFRRHIGFKNLQPEACIYFAAGGFYSDPQFNYQGALQWYNLMRGLTPIDGTPFIHPSVPGISTKFWLDGDPLSAAGRVDGVIDGPGDRRMALSSGPFVMAIGDTQEIVMATICAIGTHYLTSISLLMGYVPVIRHDFNGLVLTGAEEAYGEVPAKFSLRQNFPNPFNPTTRIEFEVSSAGRGAQSGGIGVVSLKVYNMLGQEVATLVNGKLRSGRHTAEFDGRTLPSGTYFYRLQAGDFTETKKMILVK